MLTKALRQIPVSEVAWSWGEFYNGGIQPLYDISHANDWQRLATCAIDLGLDEQAPKMRPGEDTLSPRSALARNLSDATDRLLKGVREGWRRLGCLLTVPR